MSKNAEREKEREKEGGGGAGGSRTRNQLGGIKAKARAGTVSLVTRPLVRSPSKRFTGLVQGSTKVKKTVKWPPDLLLCSIKPIPYDSQTPSTDSCEEERRASEEDGVEDCEKEKQESRQRQYTAASVGPIMARYKYQLNRYKHALLVMDQRKKNLEKNRYELETLRKQVILRGASLPEPIPKPPTSVQVECRDDISKIELRKQLDKAMTKERTILDELTKVIHQSFMLSDELNNLKEQLEKAKAKLESDEDFRDVDLDTLPAIIDKLLTKKEELCATLKREKETSLNLKIQQQFLEDKITELENVNFNKVCKELALKNAEIEEFKMRLMCVQTPLSDWSANEIDETGDRRCLDLSGDIQSILKQLLRTENDYHDAAKERDRLAKKLKEAERERHEEGKRQDNHVHRLRRKNEELKRQLKTYAAQCSPVDSYDADLRRSSTSRSRSVFTVVKRPNKSCSTEKTLCETSKGNT